MATIEVSAKDVKAEVELTPRDFTTGSIGYGLYAAVPVDGIRHQLTLNVVVNGSKKWDDERKIAWLDAHKAAVSAVLAGYADLFASGNTGWRFNSQVNIGGEACTVSGALILSKKTVAASAAKAEKMAAKAQRLADAVTANKAARKAVVDAMKSSLNKAKGGEVAA